LQDSGDADHLTERSPGSQIMCLYFPEREKMFILILYIILISTMEIKMKRTILILILLAMSIANAETIRQVKIYYENKTDIRNLRSIGLEFDHAFQTKDKALIVFLNEKEFTALRSSGYNYDVLIDDWKKYYASLPGLSESEKDDFRRKSAEKFGVTGFGFGSMGGYYTMQEVYGKLDEMRTNYPNIITQKFSAGNTLENRPMYAVKISDNPDIDEDEPEVFLNALIHAREPQAMATIVYYMFYLLENYGTDPEVTYLVNNREIFFMPIINVDGYEYNRQTDPNGGGDWRKNRRLNTGGSIGVDLNRNFGYQWGYDNNGSSGNPSDLTYRGTAPFSEPETQVYRDFVISRSFKTALNYHTYSNLLIIPWGYIPEQTADSLAYREYAADMTSVNHYTWGTSGDILYEVNGATDDWMYGEQTLKPKVISFTPEVGGSSDGFWPAQSRIFPLAQENVTMNLYLTWIAGDYVSVISSEFSSEFFLPGEDYTITPVLSNKGLSTAYDLQVVFTSLSEHIQSNAGAVMIDSIGSRQVFNQVEPLSFSVSEYAPVGQKLYFSFTTSTNGIVMSVDTMYLVAGMPEYIFNDDTNDPNSLWTITASPTTPKWEATTTSFHSAPNSYTDSKTGDYASNATVTMTMKNPVSLAAIDYATLTFWTKWDIEDSWDCGQVEISTNNGSSWTPLAGAYTVSGSGQGVQPVGEPVYDGTKSTWAEEMIDLSAYAGESIKIRFELKTDGSVQEDGWYLDDIRIFFYGGDPENSKCVDINFVEGWNLVSVPVVTLNMGAANIFPEAVSPAFAYNDGYQFSDILQNDKGYWMKFDAPGTKNLCGTRIDGNIAINPGWNIIGGNDTLAAVSQITTTPADILSTFFYGYSGGYSVVDDLVPGEGYWVRASQAGTINLNNINAGKKPAHDLSETAVSFSSADGRSVKLLLAGDKPESYYDMPPAAPEGRGGIFFEGGKIGVPGESGKVIFENVSFPVSIAANGADISLNSSGLNAIIRDGSSFILKENTGSIELSIVNIVQDYSLSQNYPNPFNPSTVISYQLKVKSTVSLKVFDVLGNEVATLLEGQQDAGIYEVNFNASDLSSGVYFYTLSVKGNDGSEFNSVRKMMLLR